MADVSVTWLGHASFRVDSPGGKRIYVDPWLGNPKCPDSEKEPERIDVIAITHGHSDHVGETVELMKQFSPEVVAIIEITDWLERKGVELELPGTNKGGTVEKAGVKFTLVNAFHSSSSNDGEYLGEAGGIVMELPEVVRALPVVFVVPPLLLLLPVRPPLMLPELLLVLVLVFCGSSSIWALTSTTPRRLIPVGTVESKPLCSYPAA